MQDFQRGSYFVTTPKPVKNCSMINIASCRSKMPSAEMYQLATSSKVGTPNCQCSLFSFHVLLKNPIHPEVSTGETAL